MDSFTQITLGATVAEVGFRKKLGGRAVLWGGFCGLAPDLDMVLAAIDPWADIIHHRGATHSLLILLLATPVFGWLGHRFGKRESDWRAWAHLSFWSLITHPMLDLFTSFGTQVLWPITNARYAFDGASIVDPLYTLPQLVLLVLALKRGEPPRWRRRLAVGVLAGTTAYLIFGTAMMHVVKSRAEERLATDGFEVAHIRVLPAIGTNLLFRVVARDEADARKVGYVSVLSDEPVSFTCVDSSTSEQARTALASEYGEIFRWFSDDLLLAREREGEIELIDLRFGTPRTPINTLFALRAPVRADGVGELERMPRPKMELGAELGSIWSSLWGGWRAGCDSLSRSD